MRLPSKFFKSDSEFFGYVTENSFKIRKNLRYNLPPFVIQRNSFSPVVIGTVEESAGGSTVRMTLRMDRTVSVFMFVFELLIILTAVFGLASGLIISLDEGFAFFLFATAFFFAIEGLLYLSFTLPAKRIITRLEDILISKYDG